MMEIQFADRIRSLPPYLFSKIDQMKRDVKSRGIDILDFGVGDPDMPTPQFIVDALQQGVCQKHYHRYPSYSGNDELKHAIAQWFQKRFSVSLDPQKEIIVLIGSKEGIAHLPLALINPNDKVLYTSPGYPIYKVATQFAGGIPIPVPLKIENNFLPKLCETQENAKLFFLNYPNNPTSATASLSFFEELLLWANKTHTILCHDAAYSEIYFDNAPTKSLLEIQGAKDIAIEFHSLSKTFNMTGWRIGFAVGNATLIEALGKIKANVDSGQFRAIQYAAAMALEKGDFFAEEQRQLFKRRRDQLISVLHNVGLEVFSCKATFYIWAKIPQTYTSIDFCSHLLNKFGIVTIPGNGFGKEGEGYFRFSLTVPDSYITELRKRLKNF